MSDEPSEQWQAGYRAALEREPARLYLEGPGAAQIARLLTAEAAIARLTDLCDEIDRAHAMRVEHPSTDIVDRIRRILAA